MSVLELAEQAYKEAEKMKSAAEQANWEKVESTKALHSETVNQLVNAQVPANQVEKIRELLIATKQLNQITEQLAVQNKASLVQERKTLSKGNKMQKALDDMK